MIGKDELCTNCSGDGSNGIEYTSHRAKNHQMNLTAATVSIFKSSPTGKSKSNELRKGVLRNPICYCCFVKLNINDF